MRAAEQMGHGAAGENGVILNVGDEMQCAIGEEVEDRNLVFPALLLTRDLKRRVCHVS